MLYVDIVKDPETAVPIGGIQPNFYTHVSSPTYNIALYVVHPSVSNEPSKFLGHDKLSATLQSGRAEEIAVSGVTTDVYIDNVVLTSYARSMPQLGNVATTGMNFDLIEPLQFGLMERLHAFAKKFKFGNMQNALYVMKLQFTGRDEVTDQIDTYPTTYFYPLTFTNISASLGPEGGRYNILCNMNAKTALSQAKVSTDISFGCRTAGDFAKNLETALNDHERNIRKDKDRNMLDVGKTWKIVLSRSFLSSYENIPLVGLDKAEPNVMQTKSQHNPHLILGWKTIQQGASIPTFVRDTLMTGLAKQLVDEGSLVKILTNIKHFEGIDKETGQLKKEITIEVLRGHTKIPDADNNNSVSAEAARRNDIQRQRQILETIKTRLHKKYEYMHTSKNTEVLDVDLNYNLQYFDEESPSGGAGSKNESQLLNADHVDEIVTIAGNPHSSLSSTNALADSSNTPVREIVPHSMDEQSYIGTGDGKLAQSIKNHELDGYINSFLTIQLSIIGDPYWIGSADSETIPNGSIWSNAQNVGRDVHIAFINYIGGESFASSGLRSRTLSQRHLGPKGRKLDIAISGVYKVANITTRLQGGKFIQQLEAFKEPDITTEFLQNELKNL